MSDKIFVTRSALPDYNQYIEKIKPLWDSHWITNMGKYHHELEEKLKSYLQVPYLSLMVNGHMSLELVIQAMGFPEGSEVITTPFTFISTTHAITRNRLIPVFCDIKIDDYTIDETKIEALITDKTVAIIPVHVYGNVCNIEAIDNIARKHNLKVIYDSAHAFGEFYKGKSIATYGEASVFSFHATKVFNTIEGGAIAFHDKQLYDILYNLKNFGIQDEETIVAVGANAKMNEFSAVMGLCNLENIDYNIRQRQKIVNIYLSELSNQKNLKLPQYKNEDITYNYGYFPVLFLQNYMRDLIYNRLKENQIYARKYFYPLTCDVDCYKEKYKKALLINARNITKNILVLPMYPELEEADVIKICKIIKLALS